MDSHTLPTPTAAVIGMAFLSGARDGQHGFLPIFPSAWPVKRLCATGLMPRMTDRPFAADPGSV
jgi:hypothetical protein